jgi:ubiquitin carboxyl-terminal hydrolase 14
MEDEIEKASPTLGRNAVYKRSTRIASLPRFLTVQFMRFYFKVGTQTKCKMLKKVAYPAKLDLTEYCAKDLKANLTCIRKKLMAISDKKLGLDGIQAAAAGGDKAVVKKKKLDNGDAAAADVADVDDDKAPEVTTSGVTSGSYELYGIVTHKGREADGGHYIGWVVCSVLCGALYSAVMCLLVRSLHRLGGM